MSPFGCGATPRFASIRLHRSPKPPHIRHRIYDPEHLGKLTPQQQRSAAVVFEIFKENPSKLRDTMVTSLAVIQELERAPEPKRSDGLALLDPLPLLESPVEADEIPYLAHKLMPRDAAGDARHLALATFHGCDILATWNCRHLANVNKQPQIRRVNAALGYATPAIVTPLELLESES